MATTAMDTRRSNKAMYWILGALAIATLIVLISMNRTRSSPASDMLNPPAVESNTGATSVPQPLTEPQPPTPRE